MNRILTLGIAAALTSLLLPANRACAAEIVWIQPSGDGGTFYDYTWQTGDKIDLKVKYIFGDNENHDYYMLKIWHDGQNESTEYLALDGTSTKPSPPNGRVVQTQWVIDGQTPGYRDIYARAGWMDAEQTTWAEWRSTRVVSIVRV